MNRVLRLFGLLATVLLVVAACSPAGSGPSVSLDVLYYYDEFQDTDASAWVVDGLEGDGHTVFETTTAATFDTELASGEYDLAIVLVQQFAVNIDTAAFTTFVADGGMAVLADWNRTASLATTFDASYSGSVNLATADLSAALASGISDPVSLTNPGWTTYSMGLVAQAGGSSECSFENDDSCLVIGNAGNTALLGFLGDTLPADDGERFWVNLVTEISGS